MFNIPIPWFWHYLVVSAALRLEEGLVCIYKVWGLHVESAMLVAYVINSY